MQAPSAIAIEAAPSAAPNVRTEAPWVRVALVLVALGFLGVFIGLPMIGLLF